MYLDHFLSSGKRAFFIISALLGVFFDVFDVFYIIFTGFSPIMRTLTSTYSTDTIWALSLVLCAMNVIFRDYHTTSGALIEIQHDTSFQVFSRQKSIFPAKTAILQMMFRI